MKSTINSIPLDLKIEILLKLPIKSVLRLRSVSKLWTSVIGTQQFVDAFRSMSLTRPRFVLAFSDSNEDRFLFFSSPQKDFAFSSSSSMLMMSKFNFCIDYICNSVRGFLCCRLQDGFVVCNPTTGQVIRLADDNYKYCRMYLGYDPKSNQYKVLRLMFPKELGSHIELEHSVLTLGGQESSHSWRSIKASTAYEHCFRNGVCIDGIVYYGCRKLQNHFKITLCSFDVGSEQLHHIETPENLSGHLTNYLGKLAVFCSDYNGTNLWVLDDVKNQVWSKKTYIFSSYGISMLWKLDFLGITVSGVIVFNRKRFDDPYELFCYDVEKNLWRVKIEGLSGLQRSIFNSYLLCDYVDNILHL